MPGGKVRAEIPPAQQNYLQKGLHGICLVLYMQVSVCSLID